MKIFVLIILTIHVMSLSFIHGSLTYADWNEPQNFCGKADKISEICDRTYYNPKVGKRSNNYDLIFPEDTFLYKPELKKNDALYFLRFSRKVQEFTFNRECCENLCDGRHIKKHYCGKV